MSSSSERARAYWQQVPSCSPNPPHADLITGSVALEVQQPWSEMLLSGQKVVETRSYPFPPWLLGERINILQTAEGEAGKSTAPDEIWPMDQRFAFPGWIIVRECIHYCSREAWEADAARHLVPNDDAGSYGWSEQRDLYGWVIESSGRHKDDIVPSMCRVHRSFFASPTEADLTRAARDEHRRRTQPPTDFAAHGPCEVLALQLRATNAAETGPRT